MCGLHLILTSHIELLLLLFLFNTLSTFDMHQKCLIFEIFNSTQPIISLCIKEVLCQMMHCQMIILC